MSEVQAFAFTIAGKSVDLAKAIPLTLGDWEKLEDMGLTGSGTINLQSGKQIIGLIYVLAAKVDPSITLADVKALPLSDVPKFAEAMKALAPALDTGPASSPTDAPSTTS